MNKALAWLLFLSLAALPPASARADEPDLRTRLEALATAGNAEAAYHLGMIHHLGLNGVARDPRKAFDLFRLAAERGDPLGAYKLGCYYHGQGEGIVGDDPVLALRYKRIAAEAGYALAQQGVAELYATQGDMGQALRWLEAAARQGDLRALAELGVVHSGKHPYMPAPADGAKSYAYMTLFIRRLGDDMADYRRAVEHDLRATTSADDIRRGEAIVAAWRAEPTPLTLKAGAGQEAAEQLVAGAR